MNGPSGISKAPIWIPAIFCAGLSLLKMFLPNGAGDPAFYSFLPMCFFFAAMVQLSLWKRIEMLEEIVRDRLTEADRGSTNESD